MIWPALTAVLLIARLPYTFNDRKMGRRQAVYYVLVLLMGLAILKINTTWYALAALTIVLILFTLITEWRADGLKSWRLISLGTAVLAYRLLTGTMSPLEINPAVSSLVQNLGQNFPPAGNLIQDPAFRQTALVIGAGYLLQLTEANLIVRTLLDALDFSPDPGSQTGLPAAAQVNPTVISDDYQAGRVIGILERSFAYLAIITGRPSIFGFILAAKAFARFKEMDNKAYAEYVLIGTMASVFLALISAELVLLLTS